MRRQRAAAARDGKIEVLLLDAPHQPIREADLGADSETDTALMIQSAVIAPPKQFIDA